MTLEWFADYASYNFQGPKTEDIRERAQRIAMALDGMDIRYAKALLDACKVSLDGGYFHIENETYTSM